MADLFWPGDEHAGDLFSEPAFLSAMVRVEAAWLATLVEHRLVPADAADDLDGLVGPDDVAEVAAGAESGGNPVIGLLKLLRARVEPRNTAAARWMHRGLTSQDVLDTALVLLAGDASERVLAETRGQVEALATLVREHRATPVAARTLTQQAVPITFGLKAATWLESVVAAGRGLAAVDASAAVQVGGAAGSLAASSELAALQDDPDPAGRSLALVETFADRLGLVPVAPWHTSRGRVTAIGDALVTCTDAWGRIATDVATLARPEVGELHEATGGGSSTMPHKQNPVLSVLLRRAAIAAPPLAATLHTASALSVDERPDGSWHAEWATLRTLARRTVTASVQARTLLSGLRVDAEAMAANLAEAGDALLAEQRSIAGLLDRDPSPTYAGATDLLVERALATATTYLQETS
ncbi:lyase family protein [Aeromicrobium sp. IC_218]|uniref:lyase family protein n=1 Tax=Aeromicrobium sp. IC_218 TaxID=2545468 RepID=UPI001040BFF7|nr:lyase family protein [Aeromicrobium sp. IC_218]TCJ00808.1 3-carboxy-cis,cis-muconate cycloisomerase [Aeromicrobium sp. IC_218]